MQILPPLNMQMQLPYINRRRLKNTSCEYINIKILGAYGDISKETLKKYIQKIPPTSHGWFGIHELFITQNIEKACLALKQAKQALTISS
jgi:hypothetical protein